MVMLIAVASWAGDFEDGLAAYNSGNYTAALSKFKLAAIKGDDKAQFNLAKMLVDQGGEKNGKEAIHLYKLSAMQGNSDALNALSIFYFLMGENTFANDKNEIKLITMIAENRSDGALTDGAQFNLGVKYQYGKGVQQDKVKAAHWYEMAAKNGLKEAQFNLGILYYSGEGVIQDYSEAVKWYKLASMQGVSSAQNNLGIMYFLGEGLAVNYLYSYMWLNLAYVGTGEQTVKVRNAVAAKMTLQQIAEAQQMTRECLARNFKNCD